MICVILLSMEGMATVLVGDWTVQRPDFFQMRQDSKFDPPPRCPNLKRFIHVSTDEVYGDLSFDEDRRVSEQDQMVPTNPYSASKAAAECLVRGFTFSFRLPSIVVRYKFFSSQDN